MLKIRELHKKNELLAAALIPSGTLSRSLSNGILPVLVLLAGKMPALQEILGYFFNWKSLRELHKKNDPMVSCLSLMISGQDARTTRNFGIFF